MRLCCCCSKRVECFVLMQSDISPVIAHAHGYYYFEITGGDNTFAVGFPSHDDAQEWLDCMLDAAGTVL